jgi:glycerol-3-phosphate dehydrogenase
MELGSALKNVYAIVMDVHDGLHRSHPGRFYGNLKAFLLSDACQELAREVEKVGRQRETVLHLAGMGDLYVTAQCERNLRFEELVGSGIAPESAYLQMKDAERLPKAMKYCRWLCLSCAAGGVKCPASLPC